MCNAITHPVEKEMKIVEELYGNGKKRKFVREVLAPEVLKI